MSEIVLEYRSLKEGIFTIYEYRVFYPALGTWTEWKS